MQRAVAFQDHIYLTLGQDEPPSEPPPSRSQLPENRGASSTEPFIPKTVKSSYDMAGTIPTETATIEIAPDQRNPISDAVRCTLFCPPMIEHDFDAYGLCRVTVIVDIQYAEEVQELSIKAFAGGMSAPAEFQQYYHGYPLMLWSTACRRMHLAADQSQLENGFYQRREELTALVTTPGIYDISSLKVSCRRGDSQWEDLPLLQSQFLTVIQRPRTEYSQLRSNQDTSMYYSMS